jgi:hypothetical protein
MTLVHRSNHCQKMDIELFQPGLTELQYVNWARWPGWPPTG